MPKANSAAADKTDSLQVSHARWLLVLIVLVGVVLRLWKITNPVLDWHAFRQADTASVTREFVKHGIDLLHPRYHDHSNIQSGKDNLEGYRMVEFPLMNGLIALVVQTLPIASIELTSRIFAILASAITTWLVYDSVRVLLNRRVAIASMIAFAILPYAVYYGRVILPEPFLLLFAMLAFWSFVHYHRRQHFIFLLMFATSLAVALLLKPFVAFYAPVFAAIHLYWWSQQPHKKTASLHSIVLLVTALVATLPFWRWRTWIEQFPTGIPASDWLFNSNGIRWRPAWFRWLGYERLTKLLLGYSGMIFLLANGLNRQQTKTWLILGSWWLGILAYFSIIATGNVQHDYYQVLSIPIVCITLGNGAVTLYDWLLRRFAQSSAALLILCLSVCSWLMAWQQISGYFNVNHWEYVEAGRAADQLTPRDAKLIAPAFGDTMFLYQTNRTGWPIGFEIEQKIKLGATHYLTTSYDDEARQLEKSYQTITKSEKYLLLDLTQPIGSSSATQPPL